MKFKISMSIDNEAFSPHREYEVARILRNLANRLEETNEDYIPIADVNGNVVGQARFL